MHRYIVLLGVLAGSSGAVAAAEAPPQTIAELEIRLAAVLEQQNTPGLIGALVLGDDVLWTGGIGVADRATRRPVGPDTLFRVGSISKTVTALAVLILQERGVLSLDMILRDFIPEVGIENPWSTTDPVRLVHAFEHTAGFDDIHPRDYVASDPTISVLGGITYNTTSRGARWRPGTRMSYSNIGPAIGGYVVEKAAGETFEVFADREVFQALGMTSATFHYDERVAASYQADGKTREPYVHILQRPSGSLAASAADMARLLGMFIQRGAVGEGRLISESSLERMERAETTLAATRLALGYGLGNGSFDGDGFVYQGHNGAIDGFFSQYAYLPQHDRGYFFSINASNGATAGAVDQLLRGFLTRDLEAQEPEPSVTEDLNHVEGYYEPASVRQEILRPRALVLGSLRVYAEDGALVMAPLLGEPFRWIPVGQGLYREEDGAVASLAEVTSAEGDQFLQGQIGTLKRVPALIPWFRWAMFFLGVSLNLSALVFALVWVPRKWFGRLAPVELISVRAWPAVTAACFALSWVLQDVDDSKLAVFSIYSGGLWFVSLVWAAVGLFSVWYVWQHRTQWLVVGRGVWLHAQLVTSVNVIGIAMAWYYGLLGVRLWAY